MCIICNLTHGENFYSNGERASAFLNDFSMASVAIKKAANSMLECSNLAKKGSVEQRRYKSTHKRMVKLFREWNKLENYRENAALSERPDTQGKDE